MTRKNSLMSTVSQYLDYDNQGAYPQRQRRRFVLHKIIDDFYVLHLVPASWFALKPNHIEQLVLFWQKNGLQNATIMNYLTHFRFFLKKINHKLEGISNADFHLTKSRHGLKPAIDRDEILSRLNDPIAWSLFALQSYFGLTLSEAMHLVPTIHLDGIELWITREISTNSKDRILLIKNAKQQELITVFKQLLASGKSLISQYGESHVRLAYRYSLKDIGLATQIQYRYLYAKGRLIELQELPKPLKIEAIKKEMSINALSTIWSYCHE